jgi:hypothetical protein
MLLTAFIVGPVLPSLQARPTRAQLSFVTPRWWFAAVAQANGGTPQRDEHAT